MGQAASAEDGFELRRRSLGIIDHEVQQDNRGNRLRPQSGGLGGRGPHESTERVGWELLLQAEVERRKVEPGARKWVCRNFCINYRVLGH
jgi:hypothetical protein